MGNHGWGMRNMIIYMCIFCILLIFIAISINSLYKRIEKDNAKTSNNSTVIIEPEKDDDRIIVGGDDEPVVEPPRIVDYDYYHSLEAKVYDATVRYLENYPTEIVGILKVSDDTLINLNYLEKLYNDVGSQRCIAYSNVYVQDNSQDYTIKSYIRCDNYSTEGY